LFATADEVRLPLFRRFASELRLDADRRGSEGIGWAEVVRRENLEEFERAVQAERMGPFEVRSEPGATGDVLVPVTFLKPDTERNRRALGFDLYSDPVRREAMDEAARMIRPTATGKLVLAQASGDDAIGFLIFMPVFESGEGGRQLMGFIYSPFDAQYFLISAMDMLAHRQMGVRLYDGPADRANLLAEHAPEQESGNRIEQQIRIANRPLLIEIESARMGTLSPLSMATLLFGLAVASLLMMLARLLTRQALEDQVSLAFFEEQNSIRNSLTRELNHRVKNTLASILSIISLTRRRTDDLDEFADGLEGRVRALSATHDLLTQSDWGTTPVSSVIEAELAPYSGGDADIRLDGPAIELAPNDALSLGLAIHELATNAAKYGALSQPGGSVTIKWELEAEDLVKLRWIERGGPRVDPERKSGFGTDLIQKIVAHELRQPVELRFDPEGVSCTLRVPVRVRGVFQIRERLARLSD
ncbi:MAG TPA: CHASE domain-containing protein, partial [Erythrobacter sp.]|nr:CHASE domain-containing protein [Erythrobacter sp.]